MKKSVTCVIALNMSLRVYAIHEVGDKVKKFIHSYKAVGKLTWM
jgi:hypothetical protein